MNLLVWTFTAILLAWGYNLIWNWFGTMSLALNLFFASIGAALGGFLSVRLVPETPALEWHFDAFSPGGFAMVMVWSLVFIILGSLLFH